MSNPHLRNSKGTPLVAGHYESQEGVMNTNHLGEDETNYCFGVRLCYR